MLLHFICTQTYILSVKHMDLKSARWKRNWTQVQLAAESGVDQSQISRIERGEIADPLNSTVIALEKALRLTRGTLVFGHREAIAS